MMEAVISAEVYCEWDTEPPAYRLYFGKDLLTERTYRWRNDEYFIRERILVHTEPGTHELKVVAVNPAHQDKFSIRNVYINNVLSPVVNNQIIIQ